MLKSRRFGLSAEPQWMEVAMEGVGSGAKASVLVQVEGGTPFPAEVQIEVDGLDPENMPLRMSGVFTKLPTAHPLNSELASFSLHSDRSGGGSRSEEQTSELQSL